MILLFNLTSLSIIVVFSDTFFLLFVSNFFSGFFNIFVGILLTSLFLSACLFKFTGEQEFINIKRKKMINENINGLYIVATPIGNLKDISERAIKTIDSADIIICENPKHSLKLLNNLGIKKKLIGLHDYNEKILIEKISAQLKNKAVALISDAGSPLISDPGYKLVQFCIKNKINITSVPGPSSIIPAIQLSGLPAHEFCFYGFVPKKEKQIRDLFKKIENAEQTSVFFVSNHNLIKLLEILNEVMPNRQISISKELTKLNEKIFRGDVKKVLNEILNKKANLKGEFVIVLGKNIKTNNNLSDLNEFSKEINMLLSKFSLTDVVEIVHKLSGKNKNKLYKWILELKK